MQLRPTVLLALTNRKAFVQCYYDRHGASGVWVPGTSPHDLGAQVDLEIAFAEEQLVLHTRGIVRSKRPVGRGALRAGIGVDFLASERHTRDLVLAFAKGAKELVRRRARRLPVVMAVEVATPTGRRREATEDVSRDGALITHASPPEVGTVIPVVLRPQKDQELELRVEVRWRRLQERPAVGVRFIFDDPVQQAAMATLLERLRATPEG